MRILIIKMSSLGDIINTLPAITDASQYIHGLQCDWAIEPAFGEIPLFHPAVEKIIPIALREWRRRPWYHWQQHHWQQFYQQLRQTHYDKVIDAQGLIKSGLITYLARGLHCGYDRHSAWEPLACLAYDKKFFVAPTQHAITRLRQLFAQILNYTCPETAPNCRLHKNQFPKPAIEEAYCVFLHGTARNEKCWPENQWLALIARMANLPYRILLPWGNQKEKQRAERLAKNHPHVTILEKTSLTALAGILAYAKANIAVDTGLGHLAAAVNSPTLSLYGPTHPELNGTIGPQQYHLKVKSLSELTADQVWEKFKPLLFL